MKEVTLLEFVYVLFNDLQLKVVRESFFLLLKNHIFIARSEDTIFIFHV